MIRLTPKKRQQILEIIGETGSARKAAKRVGCTYQAIYYLRKNHQDFADGFATAMSEYQDKLEEECDRRAYEGVDHPVTYEGRITDAYKDYSDTLLMFRLKAIDPGKYRDNSRVEHSGPNGGALVVKWADEQ